MSPSCETTTSTSASRCGREHELERLHRVAAGLRRVERGAAAGEERAARPGSAGRSAPARATPAAPRSPPASALRPWRRLYHGRRWTASTSCTASACASATSTAWATCNNAVFLTFSSRRGSRSCACLGPTTEHVILARTEIDFRSPLLRDDEVEIGVRCSRVGTKSFELEYELRSGGRLVAEAKSVLVGYDYERGASRGRSPTHWREARWESPPDGRLRAPDAPERPARPDRADAAGAVGDLHRHARRRLALRDARRRTGSRTSPSTCSSRAPSGARPRATSRARSTRSAASSTPSPARSTRATTSSAPPSTRDVALDVLVDMLRNSKFDAEEIEREKGVIVEEMNMYFDTPRDYIGGVYEELLYGDQPLGWDIIGRKETVRGATRDTFLDYLDRWYRPRAWCSGSAAASATTCSSGRGAARRPAAQNGGAPGPAPAHARERPRARCTTKQSDQAHLILGVPSYPARAPRPLRAAAARDGARRRHVVAPLHRGARAARPRLLRLRAQPQLHRRRLALRAGRRRHQPDRRGGDDDRRPS